MTSLFQELIHDLRPGTLIPALCIGLIIGLMGIVLAVSFAAMIFSGEVSHLAVRGVGLTLTGGLLACIAVALTSSFKSSISLPQDAPAAIFSGGAALMAAQTISGTGDVFMTIVAGLIISSIFTGFFLFIIACFSLVNFFRYIPYPVIGGFLAGSGWILSSSSLEVMLGSRPDLLDPWYLFTPSFLMLWLPGTALAVLLFVLLRRFSHFALLPATLVLGAVLFHVILMFSGFSLDQAREAGLLFDTLESGALWPVFTWQEMSGINWQAVFAQLPVLLTIPFIVLMGLILNVSGVELASNREIDMNREVMSNSLGNFLCGLSGSPAGYSSLSLSMMGFKTGAYTRLAGLTAAAVMALTLAWGGFLIALFPKAVLGGALMLLGLLFLWDWVIEARKKMVWTDYLIVLAILVMIAWLGFFQGVVLGILLSVVLFVIRFSQVPVLKNSFSGPSVQSPRSRPLPHKRILMDQGDRIKVFELSGYLFFGSVNSLVQDIDSKIAQQDYSDDLYAIIDFSDTSGVDISSVSAFARLLNRLDRSGVRVVFTGASTWFLYQLKNHTARMQDQEHFISFNDFNQGLQWCEDRIIKQYLDAVNQGSQDHIRSRLFADVADEMLKNLEELESIENVVENIKDYSIVMHLEKGEALIQPGQKLKGVYLIQLGGVVKTDPEGQEELVQQEYGPGDVVNLKGLFEEVESKHLYRASSASRVHYFSSEDIGLLQEKDPDMAARFYSILLRSSCK